MRVFVSGATGVIGHRAVAQLVAAGHEVRGVARSPEKAALLRSLGAEPVAIDVFDATALGAAVAGCDAVVNLTTKIPSLSKAALPGAWAENDRIRRELSGLLVDAALAGGVSHLVQESISFIYDDAGDQWIDETSPIEVVPYVESTLAAERNAARFGSAGGTAVILRFAQFYSAESSHTDAFVRATRHRLAPVVGRPDSYVSSIHADDAAAAAVAALDAPGGTYNVGDDEPMTRRDFAGSLSTALGVKPPHFLPAVASKLGGSKASMLARSQRISNAKLREATGWRPRFPSVREGWVSVMAERAESESAHA